MHTGKKICESVLFIVNMILILFFLKVFPALFDIEAATSFDVFKSFASPSQVPTYIPLQGLDLSNTRQQRTIH